MQWWDGGIFFFPVLCAFFFDLVDRQVLVTAEGAVLLVLGAEADLAIGDALDVQEVFNGDVIGGEILAS